MSALENAISAVQEDRKEPERRGRGRPRIVLTPRQIQDLESLASVGATREEQAAMLGLSVDTIQRRLRDQPEVWAALERAGARLKASIRRKQIAIALNDNHPAQATMLVWCGKVILGQSDRISLKIETAHDALERLKAAWPEIPEEELIRQLAPGPEIEEGSIIEAEVTGRENP